MSEKTRITIISISLVLALIWGYSRLSDQKSKTEHAPQTIATIPEVSVNMSGLTGMTTEDQNIIEEYQSQPWEKDPFYNGFTARKGRSPKAALHLIGILYRQLKAQALINGQAVKEGELLDNGYRVVKIAKDYVNLAGNGKIVTLRVMEESS